MPPEPLISVVIPSYNSQKHIAKCLHSLLAQETDIPYEIIVVDSSQDNTPEIIKDKFPEIKLIERKTRTLPGEGRNIGVEQAKGKIIAFIDSDCLAHPHWLEEAVSSINHDYPIVGGSVKNANPHTLISIADHILTFNEFLPTMPKKETSFMPTCNLFCRRDIFEEIGGFQADLLAGEDTLFNYQAAQKYRLLFNPGVRIAHHNRENFSHFFRHHFNFGKYSAILRKRISLPGRIFVKYPPLALLVPFVRTLRISLRMFRWNKQMLPQFILSLPLVFLGIVVWSMGFMREAFGKN